MSLLTSKLDRYQGGEVEKPKTDEELAEEKRKGERIVAAEAQHAETRALLDATLRRKRALLTRTALCHARMGDKVGVREIWGAVLEITPYHELVQGKPTIQFVFVAQSNLPPEEW